MSTSLVYFDFDGSRGLECRLALTLAGVAFDDVRLDRAQWADRKPSTPFGAVPVLEQDGRSLAQANAILTYVGRAHGMHPVDGWAAAEHEALMQSVEDLRGNVPSMVAAEELKAAREAFAAGWLHRWCETVSARVKGPLLEGDAIHVADLKLYVMLRGLRAGIYDHVPASILEAWPKLTGLVDAVDANPSVEAYWASRGKA